MDDLAERMGGIGYKRFILLLLSTILCQHFRFVSKTFQTLRPDKNFRTYGNPILYLMRYTLGWSRFFWPALAKIMNGI